MELIAQERLFLQIKQLPILYVCNWPIIICVNGKYVRVVKTNHARYLYLFFKKVTLNSKICEVGYSIILQVKLQYRTDEKQYKHSKHTY